MNIVYFDAVNDPAAGDALATQVNRFMVAQAIMLSLAGVPGIYFHSLFGSRNDRAAALETGIHRRINRQKLTLTELESELAGQGALRARVFERYRELLTARRSHAAFNPHAAQCVLEGDRRVFALLRTASAGREHVLCLHNVSNQQVRLQIATAGGALRGEVKELLSGQPHRPARDASNVVTLQPYEATWLALTGVGAVAIAAAG